MIGKRIIHFLVWSCSRSVLVRNADFIFKSLDLDQSGRFKKIKRCVLEIKVCSKLNDHSIKDRHFETLPFIFTHLDHSVNPSSQGTVHFDPGSSTYDQPRQLSTWYESSKTVVHCQSFGPFNITPKDRLLDPGPFIWTQDRTIETGNRTENKERE